MERNVRTLSTFRAHLVITSTIATLAFITVIALSMFLPLSSHLARQANGSIDSAGIAEHFLYLHAAFWPVAICSLIGCIASGQLLYAKMVGPLVQFVRRFEAIERGLPPDTVTIRGTDYLSFEAAALNRMIAAVREREALRTEALSEINSIADELLAGDAENIDPGALGSRIRDLKGLQ